MCVYTYISVCIYMFVCVHMCMFAVHLAPYYKSQLKITRVDYLCLQLMGVFPSGVDLPLYHSKCQSLCVRACCCQCLDLGSRDKYVCHSFCSHFPNDLQYVSPSEICIFCQFLPWKGVPLGLLPHFFLMESHVFLFFVLLILSKKKSLFL